MSITSSSVLVEMNISVWTANKHDKSATTKIIDDNGAATDAGRFQKNLMAGTTLRKEIELYAAGCRLWHNSKTLPWSDKGPRLLPTSLFLDYKQEANMRRDHMQGMVDEFVSNYQPLIQTAQNYLGDMFNADDYPSVEDVAQKFGFRLVFSPLPTSGDFRIDVPHQELKDMQDQYEDSFNARLGEAMRQPWDQLHKMLVDMSAKLTDSDADTKRRWYDSFVTNAQVMCGMLTHLNITKDPTLEQARRELEVTMLGADIEDIKESPAVRADMKSKVDAMLKKYEW
jgi:hypothetical protein